MVQANAKACRAGAHSVRGFTLIELLVVIAIIALLVSILMPSLQEAKLLAVVVSCQTQMKTLNTAVLAYAGDYSDKLPYIVWGANASTCQTIPWGVYWSGFGSMYGGRYVEDSRTFYCPGTVAVSGWGSNPAAIRQECKDRFVEYFKANSDNRVDYVNGWWDSCPNMTAYLKQRSIWISDGIDCFSYYYHSTFHADAKFCNIGRLDGVVFTVRNFKKMFPANSYYYPYNDRPDWAFWMYMSRKYP